MIKLIVMVIFVFVVGCKNETTKKEQTKNDSKSAKKETLKFDNPVFFMGSSFPAFMQSHQKIGNYSEMLKYTSKNTLKKFGKDRLLDFYKQMEFSYPLKLKAIKKIDGYSIVFFQTTIQATVQTIKIMVSVENDTCRICFDSLCYNSPFMFKDAN